MINADQRRAAIERPTIILDGERHEGKLLSWDAWAPYADKLSDWFHGRMTEETSKADILAFLTAIFDEPTAQKIAALPPQVFEEALVDFFNSHRRFVAAVPAGDAPTRS